MTRTSAMSVRRIARCAFSIPLTVWGCAALTRWPVKARRDVSLGLLGAESSEPTLVRLGFAFEQGTRLRRAPASAPALR